METLKLCVSCKACRHECPTGVDMAKMKIEVLAARAARHGLSLRDRLVGYLPRYADLASRLAPLANWRNNSPLLRRLLEKFAGISAAARIAGVPARHVRAWRRGRSGRNDGREVVLFADTFNRCLRARKPRCGGARADRRRLPRSSSRGLPIVPRALCCGRTFLSAGPGRSGAPPNWTGWLRPTPRLPSAACRSSG